MNKETNISLEILVRNSTLMAAGLRKIQVNKVRVLNLAKARAVLALSTESAAKRLASWKTAWQAKSPEEKAAINLKKSESYKKTLQTKGRRIPTEEEKILARKRRQAAWFAKPRQVMIEIRNKKIAATWQAKSQEERDILTVRRLAIKKAN